MKILVISPKAAEDSAKRLAVELGADYINPYQTGRISFRDYKLVINYGFSTNIITNADANVFNEPFAVRRCINKLSTLQALSVAGIPVPDYAQAVKKNWDTVVCHTKLEGRKNEGIEYWYRESDEPIPPAYLYTKYYEHRGEYRVVVLCGKVVGRYRKVERDGTWDLELRDKRGFEHMDAICIRAARALSIDYVGFDVLAQTKNDCVIIEANSGPILTEEAIDAFHELIGA
jgi:glutathione synthase/RimK-type ligase-like ATP-grasp enzyme